MFEFLPDSDGEIGSETLNSSQSSMSSDSYSSRVSFDAIEILSTKTPLSPSQESVLSSKPHRSSDSSWEAIRAAVLRRKTGLSFRDFKLIRRIGSGDIGTVYLCRLRGGSSEDDLFYAMKVVDKEALAKKKKVERAETEKRILRMLDHPFLPTLYAEFEASHFSCVVMEFCSGGDLHTLRHKQQRKRFSLSSARSVDIKISTFLHSFLNLCIFHILHFRNLVNSTISTIYKKFYISRFLFALQI